jgi:hypothetical protein
VSDVPQRPQKVLSTPGDEAKLAGVPAVQEKRCAAKPA